MLQTYKGDPQRFYKFNKHQLNSFTDSNNTTTTLKIRPRYVYKNVPFKFISPFNFKSPIYFRQSLYFPLNKRHSFGIQSDVYRRPDGYIQNFGLVYQYTNINNSKIILKGYTGSVPCASIQYHKKLDQNKILSFYGSSSLSLKNVVSSYGVGYKHNRFHAVMTTRIGFGHIIKMNYKYPISRSLTLKLQANILALPQSHDINTNIVDAQASLNYEANIFKGSLITSTTQPGSLKIQFETRTSIGRLFVCNQFLDEQNIIYIGLKRHNCKLSIPVAASNSIVITALFAVAYLMGFILRKQIKQDQVVIKDQEERIKQLRLIEDKANQFYKKQQKQNGLRIQLAYYGDQNIINTMCQDFNTNPHQIPRVPRDFNKGIDVTVSLRYYTQKGKLKLPKSKKSQLFGFCDIDIENPKLIIIYHRGQNNNRQIKVVNQFQSVQI